MNCNCKKETCNCNLQAVGCNNNKCTELIEARCVIFNREGDLSTGGLGCIGLPWGSNLETILKNFDEELCKVLNCSDRFAQVSITDTSTGYLENKIIGSPCISLTKVNSPGNESLLISPIIDPDTTNTIVCRAGGLYSKEVDPSIRINITDTCPAMYLNDKFSSSILDIAGTPGFGNHCGDVVIYGIPAASFTETKLIDIVIGGNIYSYTNSTDIINDCQELTDVLNTIFLNNNLTYRVSNITSSTVSPDSTSCSICVTGVPSGSTVILHGTNTTNPGGVIANWEVALGYDTEALDPYYFNKVYKKIEDDGTGCKTISFYAHNLPQSKPICQPITDVDALFVNTSDSVPTLLLIIATINSSSANYIVDIEELRGGNYDFILEGALFKQQSAIRIPLTNYQSGDLRITVTKDCGCCSKGTSSFVKLRPGFTIPSTACDTNGWIDIPDAWMVNGWSDVPPVPTGSSLAYLTKEQIIPFQYRIDRNILTFRGRLFKNVTFNTNSNKIAVTEIKSENIFFMTGITCFDWSGQDSYGTKDIYTSGVQIDQYNFLAPLGTLSPVRDFGSASIETKVARNTHIFSVYQHVFAPSDGGVGSISAFIDIDMSGIQVIN